MALFHGSFLSSKNLWKIFRILFIISLGPEETFSQRAYFNLIDLRFANTLSMP